MGDKVLVHGALTVKVLSAKGIANKDGGFSGLSDPYALVSIDGKEVARTAVIDNTLSPKWKAAYEFDVVGERRELQVELFNKNSVFRDDHLGFVSFSFKDILTKQKYKGDFPLKAKNNDKTIKGTLKLQIRYICHSQLDSFQLRNSAFPMHRGCKVTLFQDAHVGEDCVPPQFAGQEEWLLSNNAFETIYKAMMDAKKFIYITGWSVNPHISLLRRRPLFGKQMLTMGDLLRMKADKEGVKVILHLWDEKLSMDIGPFSSSGMMGTFDEVTKQYFQNSKVVVKLSYRTGSLTGEFYWSHHQKTVILDAPLEAEYAQSLQTKLKAKKKSKAKATPTRRIIAFVGGLDLTSGRWDTPSHSLFKTLNKEHLNDFHQPWKYPQSFGPRQPWHDIHTKVEGGVARDVLTNFEQRWAKQASDKISLLYQWKTDADIIEAAKDKGYHKDDPESWNVQLFRSIDSHSATIRGVERSIQDAYLNAIRAAKNFLYIENQYFMGGCREWAAERDSGCENLIPLEIATKIATSLQHGKPFHAYIIVPMFPEGVPSEKALQEMLRWQWLTIEMMYNKVAQAIKQYGPQGAHPTDYLNFYCLGNRELVEEKRQLPPGLVCLQTRRFMIYVHSKLMIADDEYIICGSANINERSMAGNRDTEIAIGAYQPNKKIKNSNSAPALAWSGWTSQVGDGISMVDYNAYYQGFNVSAVPSPDMYSQSQHYAAPPQQPPQPQYQSQQYPPQQAPAYPPIQDQQYPATAYPAYGYPQQTYQYGYNSQYQQQPYDPNQSGYYPPQQQAYPNYGYSSGYQAPYQSAPAFDPMQSYNAPAPYPPAQASAPAAAAAAYGYQSGYAPAPAGYASQAPQAYPQAPAAAADPNQFFMSGYPLPLGPPAEPPPSGVYTLNSVKMASSEGIDHPLYGSLPAVKRFRISLWTEHLGAFMPEFVIPNDVATARKINQLAEENWKKFTSKDVCDMTSHLMKYPIEVSENGRLTPKEAFFPDTTANIMGSASSMIPNALTQ